MEHFMNFRKSVVLSVLFLSVFFTSYSMKEQPVSVAKQMDRLVEESFDSLLNYNFLNSKHQTLALQMGKTLIELIDADVNNNLLLEDILDSKYWVESKLAIWQAAAFVSDEFESLSYRRLQEVKLEMLNKLIVSSVVDGSGFLNTRASKKLIKSFNIPKKLYSKYRKLFEADSFVMLDSLKDYFSFMDSYLKSGSSFDLSLDEQRLDNLILRLSFEKQGLDLKLGLSFAAKLFKKQQRKTVIQIIELYIQNLLKIKANHLYNKNLEVDFNNVFKSNDSLKKMLVIKHYVLLTKKSFKEFLQDNETSTLFNNYLDLVIFYLNNQNALGQPLFIYNFFQLYSDLDDLKEKNKGIIPFISFGGNGELLDVIDEMQENLNIILKNVNDKMGTGLGWLPKMLLGKAEIPPKVMNFALKLLEEKVLSKA